MKKIKITFLGDSFVGKSTFINCLRKKEYSFKYHPTIFDNSFYYLTHKNKKYELDMSDTSGSPEYQGLREKIYPQTDIFIICYAVNNIDSLNSIGSYCSSIKSEKTKILLGLKNDTRYNQSVNSSEKIISFSDGMEIADRFGLLYFEYGFLPNFKNSDNISPQNIMEKVIDDYNIRNTVVTEKRKKICCLQ